MNKIDESLPRQTTFNEYGKKHKERLLEPGEEITVEHKCPPEFMSLYEWYRYRVYYGGRSSGKSWNVAISLMMRGVVEPLRILCCREFMSSINESVHKLLVLTNDRYKLGYTVTATHISHPNGTEFFFEGLRNNATKIKSIEGTDICWIEEASTISEDSWEILVPTIRKKGSEIIVIFNPDTVMDKVYRQFIIPNAKELLEHGVYSDDKVLVQQVNYTENPFLTDEMHYEIETMKEADFKKYQHIYLGMPIANDELNLIPAAHFDAAIDAHLALNFPAEGLKVGGYDPSDGGADAQAFCFRHGSVVKDLQTFRHSVEDGCVWVHDYMSKRYISFLVYDTIGLGVGVRIKFQALDPAESIDMTAFVGSETPRNPLDTYKNDLTNKVVFGNIRAQYYKYLADRFANTYRAISTGAYIDPDTMISIASDACDIDQLRNELCNIQRRKHAAKSLIQIESKKDMTKRGMKSPNMADALMYAFANDESMVFNENTLVYATEW